MPKAFNEREKELIKDSLMEKGRNLFSAYGLKKTSIEELTRAVGIAQGSFYNFFGSKEELCFEILEREEERIKSKLLGDELLTGKPPDVIKNLLTRSFEAVEKNSLIRRLYLEGEYELLVRKLPREKIEDHINRDSVALLPLIRQWQAKGVLKQENPRAIVGVIRSLFLISLHKREIGEEEYKDTVKLLIDLISEGIAGKEAES